MFVCVLLCTHLCNVASLQFKKHIGANTLNLVLLEKKGAWERRKNYLLKRTT